MEVLTGDNLEISGNLPKNFSAVIFDPPFQGLYKFSGSEYSDFIKPRLDSSCDKLIDSGVLVSINFEHHTNVINKYLENNSFKQFGTITLKRTDRGKTLKHENLVISFNSKKRYQNFNLKCDVQHKSGFRNTDITEAMPEHEAEKITYILNRTKTDTNILDMFGGSGTIPTICTRHNINCTSIELEQSRAFVINARIKMEEAKLAHKECIICGDKKAGRNLCEKHYGSLYQDYQNKRYNELRGWNQTNKITSLKCFGPDSDI